MTVRNRRERRDGWAAGRFRLNPERDPMILYAIGRSKLLTTRDVATLAFGSRETARDRLRKLHCAGLVRAHVRDLAKDNVYSLTARGRDLVVDHLDVDPAELTVARGLPRQLDHLLGVNRMRVCLTAASRLLPYAPLRAFVAEWELGVRRRSEAVELVPDALVKLADKDGRRHFVALEVDLGTENPSYVAAHKLRMYEKHLLVGTPVCGVDIELVVLVAPGARRLRSLAKAIGRAGLRLPVALGDLEHVDGKNAFTAYAMSSPVASSSVEAVRGLLVRPLLP